MVLLVVPFPHLLPSGKRIIVLLSPALLTSKAFLVRHNGLNVFAIASTFNDLCIKNFAANTKTYVFLFFDRSSLSPSFSVNDSFFQSLVKSSIPILLCIPDPSKKQPTSLTSNVVTRGNSTSFPNEKGNSMLRYGDGGKTYPTLPRTSRRSMAPYFPFIIEEVV